MAKITLNDLTTNYGSQTLHNNNNSNIEDHLNNKVLYRDNPTGEPNQMEQALDMNSNKVINAADGAALSDLVTLRQLTQATVTSAGGLEAALAATDSTVSIAGYEAQILKPFDTVADMLAGITSDHAGKRVSWLGYYAVSDGGSGWGIVKTGAHTDDGGLILSAGASLYVEQNLKGGKLNAKKYGIKSDVADDQTTQSHVMFASNPQRQIRYPSGTYKVNLLVPTNIEVFGGGRRKTIFQAFNSSSPIIEFGDDSANDAYFIGGGDFGIDGETTAVHGLRIGRASSSRTVTYGHLRNIEITSCLDNFYVHNVVGLRCSNVYSHDATVSALNIESSDIVTTAKFSSCQFRQSDRGLDLSGGSLLKFSNCVIESNKDIGLYFSRVTSSGARQVIFDNCWFENNGHTPSTAIPCSIYVDMTSAGATAEWPSYLKFNNCTVSSASGTKNLIVNRGYAEFDTCAFDALDSTRLQANSGTGYAFAYLRNCGTITGQSSPAIYASIPALAYSSSGQIVQGFVYDYVYRGARYTNAHYTKDIVQGSLNTAVSNVTGTGTVVTSDDAGIVSATTIARDPQNSWSSGVYTAATSKTVNFNALFTMTGLTASANRIRVFVKINTTDIFIFDMNAGAIANVGGTTVVDVNRDIEMTAGQTLKFGIIVTGEAGDVVDLTGSAGIADKTAWTIKEV